MDSTTLFEISKMSVSELLVTVRASIIYWQYKSSPYKCSYCFAQRKDMNLLDVILAACTMKYNTSMSVCKLVVRK